MSIPVEVDDAPAGKAVSIGVRGAMTDARVAAAKAHLEAWLKAHPKVEKMSPRPVAHPYASAVVDLQGDIREQFISELIAAGFGIRLVEVPDDELEEIFLGLTRGEVSQ